MKNFVQEGKIVDFANGSTAIVSGDVVIQGKIIGVAVTDIAANANGAVAIRGVFALALAGSLAITAGDEVFWDSTNKVVTKTATDNPLGVAVTTQLANDPLVNVLINVGAVGSMAVAADVAAFGSTTNIPASACAGGSTPTATNVNGAIDTVTAVIETRLDNIETKVNAILTALKNAGQMS